MKSLGKLRKIFAVGVTVLMAVSLFAGCGDEKKSADSGKSSNVAEDIAAIKKRGVLRVGVKNSTKGWKSTWVKHWPRNWVWMWNIRR